MAVIHTYVITRLCRWAEWRLRHQDGGIGYPRNAPYAKSEGSGFWTPADDLEGHEMDQCVCALMDDRKFVVMLEFTLTGTQEQKAKQCGCCLRTYHNRLQMAYLDLLGFLNDKAAGVPLPSLDSELESQPQEKMIAQLA